MTRPPANALPRRSLMARLGAFALLLAGVITSPAAQAELPSSLTSALARFEVPEDALSVVVMDRQGRQVLSHNAGTARHPGSTIKLVTTFAALSWLSPIHDFKTEVLADGPIADGVLTGNLVLRGEGDPLITTETFWQLVRTLKQRGVTRVTGDLVLDTSYYDLPATDPGAFDGQPYRLYNTQPYPLLVNFKAQQLTFRPLAKRVAVSVEPDLPNFTLDNRLAVRPGGCNVYQAGISLHAQGGRGVRAEGRMPAGCGTTSLSRTFMSHPDYIYGLFQLLYTELGGELAGGVREAPTPETAERLFVWESKPLREIIIAINKYSNNAMTRMLMLNLGAELFGAPATPEKGRAALRSVYERMGVDVADLKVDNGSGLSRDTRISAGTMAAILDRIDRSPYAAELIASMPITGLDGTLRRRLKGRDTRGTAHLKTGRLDGVSALAGFVHDDSGESYRVVFFMNHPKAHRGVGNALGDALIQWVQNLPPPTLPASAAAAR